MHGLASNVSSGPCSHVHAAIHMEGLARDVACRGRGQKENRISDLFRHAQAAHRHRLQQLGLPLVLEFVSHVALDEARGHTVHSDAPGRHLPAQGSRKALHAGLSCCVVGLAGVAHGAHHGGDGDDPAPTLLRHALEHGLRHAVDGVQVGVDDGRPVLLLHAEHQRVARDASVVDQDVHRAVLRRHGLHEGVDVLLADDIQLHALALQVPSEACRDRLGAGVGGGRAHDGGPCRRELVGDRRADAARGARDKHHLAAEVQRRGWGLPSPAQHWRGHSAGSAASRVLLPSSGASPDRPPAQLDGRGNCESGGFVRPGGQARQPHC
mmetsp:Transcript_86415/g.209501  ORF Transcript_86415/g.209501 Transcript_86415/m.209501 type:complete len:324 (-) Transcript_86415:150-1121(-)